jgi:hypothetical protein
MNVSAAPTDRGDKVDAEGGKAEMILFWSRIMQSVGLVSDIAGATLLFRFGLPPIARTGGANYMKLAPTDEADLAEEEKFDRYGWLGLLTLVFGFVLQLIPDAMLVFCEWRR